MASSITIHVKILSGEMISVSFDPELGLSSIYQSIAKQMNCHSSQIHLFSLMHEKKEEEKSWIPSDNEIVGILIKILSLKLKVYVLVFLEQCGLIYDTNNIYFV